VFSPFVRFAYHAPVCKLPLSDVNIATASNVSQLSSLGAYSSLKKP